MPGFPSLVTLIVVAATALGCSRSPGPCPEGAALHGSAPPAGTVQWCAKPDGKKEGRWVEWYPGGKIKSEGNYASGKMEGRWVSSFENGVKKLEGEYRGGIKQGVWILYYEEGTKNREEVHADAHQVKWTAWRSDGTKWAEGTLLDHHPQGAYAEWHPSGLMAVQGQYEKGEKAGAWKYWDPDGKPSDTPQGDFAKE